MDENEYVIETEDVNLYYGKKQALKGVNIKIRKNRITALMGPSGCGKSTLLRSFNRMNDLIGGCRTEGKVYYNGRNICDEETDVVELRKSVGMVFQKPNPFLKSIYENVAYGPRIHGIRDREKLDEIVERGLKDAALWEEVEDRLHDSAMSLSGGQQQRLCIARALAVEPEVLLMDEPASALDPISTAKIEDLMEKLKRKYTVVIVTHNMEQAARVSDYAGFMYIGELIEFGKTKEMFQKPKEKLTENYIRGLFG